MTADKTTHLKYAMRTAQGEEDFWLVRRFLSETWQLMPPFFNWETRRWDSAYWHNAQPGWDSRWGGGKSVGLWQASNGRLLGAVHPEDVSTACLQVHRDHRQLESEMLDWAEANLARSRDDGTRRLGVFAWDFDDQRRELLSARGYQQLESGDVMREKPYAGEETAPRMPDGYRLHRIRPGNPEDCERYAALLNAAFRRVFHSAAEIATFTLNSPSFDPQLELVAVAPDGSFAALAGLFYDADNSFGLFEPVCATPLRRPLGLTAALMQEGHRRVHERGAKHCYVPSSLGRPANRFYDACGFCQIQVGHMWKKEL